MQFIVKLAASLAIIIIASQIGRRYPTLGGLIATMPLTSLVVLLWIYSDNPADHKLLREYSLGALWGIAPTILFFAAVSKQCHRFLFSQRNNCRLNGSFS